MGAIETCPECNGAEGRSVTWDDDLDIRHQDWVPCQACSADYYSGHSDASEGGPT